MSTVMSVISIALIAAFTLINVASYCCVVRFLVSGTNFSAVPFLEGILGSLGCLLSSHPTLRHLWWLPLILDYGSAPFLAFSMLLLVKKGLQRI